MISRSSVDKFYYYYFLTHIPITILMDSSLIIPSEYQLQITRQLLKFHISQNKDFLISDTELWLKFFGLIELVLQLPFFIISVLQNLKSPNQSLWNLIYSVNVVLTTACCLVYVVSTYEKHGLNTIDAVKLFAIYTPYLIIPLFMFFDSINRITLLNNNKKTI